MSTCYAYVRCWLEAFLYKNIFMLLIDLEPRDRGLLGQLRQQQEAVGQLISKVVEHRANTPAIVAKAVKNGYKKHRQEVGAPSK